MKEKSTPRVDALISIVEKDLHVRPELLGLKLFLLHLFASVVTLSLCQQFGMKLPLAGSVDLMHVFMRSGALLCQVFCGAFYLGVSFALMPLFLPRIERGWVRKRLGIVALAFTAFSALLLSLMGTALAPLYLAGWGMGAYLASLGAFYASRFFKDLPWVLSRR